MMLITHRSLLPPPLKVEWASLVQPVWERIDRKSGDREKERGRGKRSDQRPPTFPRVFSDEVDNDDAESPLSPLAPVIPGRPMGPISPFSPFWRQKESFRIMIYTKNRVTRKSWEDRKSRKIKITVRRRHLALAFWTIAQKRSFGDCWTFEMNSSPVLLWFPGRPWFREGP